MALPLQSQAASTTRLPGSDSKSSNDVLVEGNERKCSWFSLVMPQTLAPGTTEASKAAQAMISQTSRDLTSKISVNLECDRKWNVNSCK